MNKKLFWTPGVQWLVSEEQELFIEECCFPSAMTELFPKFYFLLCKGIEENEIAGNFPEFPALKLKRFVKKLKELGFLSDSLSDTFSLFDKQIMLFQPENPIQHDYFLKKENVESFRQKALTRRPPSENVSYKLKASGILPETFRSRRTVRDFDMERKVSEEQISAVLECLAQYSTETGAKYCYPSAGGLYPIDCYVHIKKDRVEGIEEGLYFFDPIGFSLNYVSSGKSIARECHYFLNRDIFETSAFSVYLFYNAEVSMPKYESRAYYYGIYDAGILTGYLNIASETAGISSCSIGEMKDFDGIASEFDLTEHQVFLHSIEFGLRR